MLSPRPFPCLALALATLTLTLSPIPKAIATITVTGDVTPTYNGTDDPWVQDDLFKIGTTAAGSLEIDNGSVVKSMTSVIGNGSDGHVTVTGSGSQWDLLYVLPPLWDRVATLTIGSTSTGILNVTNGATVDAYSISVGVHGAVYVSGPGSEIVVHYADISGAGYIEFGGADLTIENGGRVSSYGSGLGSGSQVLVTGAGSAWGLSTEMTVGHGGSKLRIENGGQVTFGSMVYLDGPDDLSPTVTVTGPGSSWKPDMLITGSHDNGHLYVGDGGTVESIFSYIGEYAGSVGSVTITGTGSEWENLAGSIEVGKAGTGTLTVSDNGLVTSSYGITLGMEAAGSGTLNLQGGSIDLRGGGLDVGQGSGIFNFSSGELRNAGYIDLKQTFVQDGGTLVPGGSIGQTSIIGNFDLNAGTLEIELGGIGNPIDLVSVTGDINIASLDTILDLRALGPMAAGTYTLLETTGGTITGMFEDVVPFNLFGVNVSVQNTGSAITLTLDSDLIFADANGDGFVGLDDLDLVLKRWNRNVTPGNTLRGDLDGDGYVGLSDLDAILTHWNAGTPPPADILTRVPEPGTTVILVLGISGIMCRRPAWLIG